MSSLVDFPVSLPTSAFPPETNASDVASAFTSKLNDLQEQHFVKDALWRDTFALTGTLRTFYSAPSIFAAWKETSSQAKVGNFATDPDSAYVVRIGENVAWLDVNFTFETSGSPQTTCSGFLSLVPDGEGGWQIWLLRTILEQLKGHGNVDVLESAQTNGHGGHVSNGTEDETSFDCVVIGGGQAGLSAGGRMKALGISYVILDKNPEVGDSWKRRYNSARLHTTREYAHLPFDRTFPSHYQELLTKDDLAQGYKDWVSKFGINIWQKSSAKTGTWDPIQNVWTLNIQRDGNDRTLKCKYIVLAGGGGFQTPSMPIYADRDIYQGTVLHSADYTEPSTWKNKHGVVVGTANTAHDAADDMLSAGLASVTMIQRGITYVLPLEYYKVPTEIADRIGSSNPNAVADLASQLSLKAMVDKEPERFDALERAGFKVDRYGSIIHHIANRMGGHYLDVGVSKKISDGLITMKSDSVPIRYTRDGLEFADGSVLKADLIVFATGFVHNMKLQVKDLFGAEIAEQMGDYWGLDEEGELKGAFKRCGHPALFYHGGTQGHARFFSRFIALQIKAGLLGTPLALYKPSQMAKVLQ
ncbi:putative indole-3-pyruvate monooxygenase [Lachnellula suecica]|uniref:Putative indole-3-pyruvate monooxygenase n=1 Tax=Lachnellula suecica TaxID=602035 RepID=A0A8T9C7P8_9HELO|nr:putative indole-3-pyruvate monooxygenase [Lachnellula suecica]